MFCTPIRVFSTPLLQYSITPKEVALGNTIDFDAEIRCCIKLDQR
jgi:hypothetical protein